MNRPKLLLLFVFGLSACQPKGTLLYHYSNPDEYSIEQVVVVIDYLNLKDDIGKLWDFDAYYHQQILNKLLADVDWQLQQSGYPKIDSYLLSSGLLVNNQFVVEHYIQDQLQPGLLYPPYILASQNIDDTQISQHQEFLTLLVKYIGQRRHQENDEWTHRGMQMGYHFASMDLPANTGILYLQIDQSAPGIIKQLGTLLVTGAIASQADYSQVSLDLRGQRQANAFFIHKGSGQILWKNHSSQWSPIMPVEQLLAEFPTN